MNNKSSFERYNIILIILFFVIPILAFDLGYYFLSKHYNNRLANEKEKKANDEVETLASESDFGKEFAMYFRDYFNLIKEKVDNSRINETNLSEFSKFLEQNAGEVFKTPFPNYNLYVFKLSETKMESELIYYKGDLKSGKKALCKAFDGLYAVNTKKVKAKEAQNNKFIQALIGKYSSVDVVANEMLGCTTHTRGIHECSWFIWDYFSDNLNTVYGCILLCDDINNYAEKGRLLALERLKNRKIAASGAFIPVYSGFGKANILSPLEKSSSFNNFADGLTIKEEKEYFKWIKEPLPQDVHLGNYTAYCFLERGASHIAVILIKPIKDFSWPKWLIILNFLSIFILLVILYCGIVFQKWPQISLSLRFTLSYSLASVIPISLLCITAYGYLLQYKSNATDKAANDLLISLKSIDAAKLELVKEYRATFAKALEDPEFIELAKKGFNEEAVAKRIVDIFEGTDNALPILGAKVLDENGKGPFAKGNFPSNITFEDITRAFDAAMVPLLRNEMLSVHPELKFEKYEVKETENDLANKAYLAITGSSFDTDLNRHFGFPIYRKNGDFCSYLMFDLIKIDGEIKYMLFVVWDDKALDDEVVKRKFRDKSLKDNKQNFLAYRVKGQNAEYIGEKTRHSSEKFKNKAPNLAIETSYSNKTTTFEDEEYIVALMPSFNYSQTVLIGWKDKFEITEDINNKAMVFVRLILLALTILLICSIRSSAVFLKPISSLKEALDEVSKGNLNVGFKDSTKDELGQLSNELSIMISELREKERLSKLISDQAIQVLQKKNNEMLNDTESFKGVALVSDIRNFTGMSEQYAPEAITELLNEHFAEMAKIISDNGGLIYKFIGDAIEAVFPEKEEYDESASVRAFKAGSMMIAKLSIINSRRRKKNLFPYRIGVGLCYGSMFSGTVGSLETRLDYSILGDPLKNAAKYEALSIQNPSFPLVFGEDIAEILASKGMCFKKIDSKGNNFNVFVLDEILNAINTDDSIYSNELEKKENKENKGNKDDKSNEIKLFSISNIHQYREQLKQLFYNAFIVLFISLFITMGVNTVYFTKFDNLKTYSDKECSRLENQLNCDELLRSVFDTLCLYFYEDINNILNSEDNSLSFEQKIKKVADKYEKLNVPIPKYYCCQYVYDNKNNCKINAVSSKGFSDETVKNLDDFALSLITDKDKETKLNKILGISSKFFNMNSLHYRRSGLETVEKESMLIDTDKIISKDRKHIIAYVFCGMPQKMDKSKLINYYTILAGKNLLLAIKDKNDWYFSHSFPQKEKLFLQQAKNTSAIEKKGYYTNKFQANNEDYIFYAITKELAANNYSVILLNNLVFIGSLIVLGIIIGFVRREIFISSSSVASKLRLDICISALLPLLTVCFLSHLYINEDLNVKKTETIASLNKLIDDTERKELYCNALCENYFKNLSYSEEINKYINKLNNSKNDTREKIEIDFSDYLKKNVAGYNSEIHKSLKKGKPFYCIKEIIFIGKDGWISAAAEASKEKVGLTDFGKLISEVGKNVYLSKDEKNQKNSQAVKSELMVNTLVKTLESIFGSDFTYKLISFPNNFITFGISYSIVGFYVSPYPDIYNPDYLIIALVLFDANYMSDLCNMINDTKPYKQHISSGGVGTEKYSFYSSNIRVGESFFLDNQSGVINHREDLKSVRELGLAASWVNTSFGPVSRMVDLYGPHFLEARQGYYVKDGVFATLASEIPLRKKANETFISLGWGILFSLLMIFLITQSVIQDLIAPVMRLIEGAAAVSKDNYKFRTQFKRRDELGALCDSFDKMMKGLEEKQLMNRMVSKTALKVSANVTDVDSKKINVVLLYVSVPAFDKIMKKTPINELFSELRKQVANIAEIVISNGGDIDKIMGEKMLIAFHIGDKNPKDVAVLACKVAHMIESSDKISFKVSVGVNYGQVISGFLGVGEKRDFTIIGDPVNVSARIAVLGEKLEKDNCLISETIYYYINDSIKANLYGKVELKGKSQPMKVYQLS
jgi:adenylate cyclase